MIKRRILAVVMAACASLEGQADDFSDRIDTLFNNLIAEDEPGCSVGVIESGQLIYQAGYGLANMENQVPMTGHNVHRMASVSKQFTAMAVHLLADEGKIDLDADIRTYLPGLRDYSETVTVNAMLGHVSGMVNDSGDDYEFWTSTTGGDELVLESAFGGPFLFNQNFSIDEYFRYIQKLPLRYSPNEKFHYSNIAYFLLAMLVEEVSGQSLRDYADRKIFKPLGMSNTMFLDSPRPIIDGRVTGYNMIGRDYVRDDANVYTVGAGGLYTTVNDMLKWDRHFYQPQLGFDPESLIRQFNQPNSALKKYGRLYANGQMVTERHGESVYLHHGGFFGTRTYYGRYSDADFSIMVFCNDASRNAGDYAKAIEQYYFYPNN
ncbi:serine hydrolase domain-containing protein [Saccharospirillum salsuginis]|uniref:Serine hydrolase n=1 Tax=Saccharospirillum salsuginis TaxID=418750 RepID=A0A918K7X7_9GAMM|nr:serine hydrolase domain-containing protein [Saccharospirillum salsuginis]GGX54123.1 serine hydrolase [Saccharospirillum salsuginis]